MELGSWLRNLGLGRYESAFIENAVDLDVVTELTEIDLENLGIPLGDRKRLIKAIKALSGGSSGALDADVAERRHLSVMICDLVGSTALSRRLDPEDLDVVMDAFQAVCAGIVRRYEGFIADYRGDGVLACFGYPQAHEDDAERTVRSGLEIAAAVGRLKTPAPEPLTVRIGIASGLVVVRNAGEGALRKHSLSGETPNHAARLQTLADPGTVVVAASTRRLLGDRFRLRNRGLHNLRGITDPISAWTVEGISDSDRLFERTLARRQIDLFGREAELDFLLQRQRLAWSGQGQVVLISGEPGIGKSRLAKVVEERVADEPHTVLRYQCSPYHTKSPLHPFIARLERAAGFNPGDSSKQRLDKLEALLATTGSRVQDNIRLLASLLAIPFGKRYPRLTLDPIQLRQRTFLALLDEFETLAYQKPILLLFEDLHWTDSSSLELLDLLIERMRQLPVLGLFTFRPDFEPAWIDHPNVGSVALPPLDRRHVESLVANMTAGRALPPDVMSQILQKTDGNPLFVEEITKAVLESNILLKHADHYRLAGPLPPFGIPETLQDSLMARLDRLAPVKEVGQIGAVVGREFSYLLMRELVGGAETALKDALSKLEEAELLFRRGQPPHATYSFKHALVRDVAYESLLKSRRKQLHGVIAHTIESKFSDMADSQPEIVARHFTEAELIERAVHYWLKAGQLALGRSAKTAVSHLEQGLRLVASIENAPLRKKSELLLRISLGNSLRTTQGWSSDSVGREYTRALQLCSESGLDEHTLPAVFGLWTWNFLHPALRDAQALAEQLLNTAEKSNEPTHKVLAHEALGFTLFAQGRFCAAHSQLERSTSICGETEAAACLELSAQEPRVHAKLYDGMTLWFLGYPDQGLRACAEACLYADASEHPFSQAMARTISLRVHQLRGEAAIVASQADAAIALCEEHEFAHYLAMSSILRGWAMAQQGKFEKGVAEIQQGLEKQRAIGALLYDSYSLGLLADACISNGHCEQAMEPLRQAESRLQDEGSARFYAAEIYRLLGEAHLRAGHNADIAECYFNCGLDIAREQNARSLELKLCESLCRLYDLGRSSNRYKPLLENVYRSFTEGFETADLVNAKAALHAANFA